MTPFTILATLGFVPHLAPRQNTVVTATACQPTAAAASRFAAAAAPRFARVAMDATEEICDVLPDQCEQIEADADAIFTIIDLDGDGTLTRKELAKHLTSAGYKESAVDMIFNKIDTDASGCISRDELKAAFLSYTPLRSAPGLGAYNIDFVDEIHVDADTLFAAIDKNGDGEITKKELQEHLKEFSSYSFKAISSLYKLLDVNKDGAIEKAELRDAFVKYSALRQAIGDGPNYK